MIDTDLLYYAEEIEKVLARADSEAFAQLDNDQVRLLGDAKAHLRAAYCLLYVAAGAKA